MRSFLIAWVRMAVAYTITRVGVLRSADGKPKHKAGQRQRKFGGKEGKARFPSHSALS